MADDSSTTTWKVGPSGTFIPLGLILLGVAAAYTAFTTPGQNQGPMGIIFFLSSSLFFIATGLWYFTFAVRSVSCDADGSFHFSSSRKEVVADPGEIIAVKVMVPFDGLRVWPFILKTTSGRVFLMRQFENMGELGEMIVQWNPEAKYRIGPYW